MNVLHGIQVRQNIEIMACTERERERERERKESQYEPSSYSTIQQHEGALTLSLITLCRI
jgi:hypothetical protein